MNRKSIIRTLFLAVSVFSGVAMAQENKAKILVLIHSDNGGTYELAKEIESGIEKDHTAEAVIKLVKPSENPKLKNLPVVAVNELSSYDGIAFGSPVYFGNISTGMSEFLSKTVDLWTKHALEGMPATVFMSAGSGAGKELALQSFWNSLAVHGMILVSNGIRGTENIDKNIPQGNSVLGITSMASLKDVERPTKSERYLAALQGQNFASVANALKGRLKKAPVETKTPSETKDISTVLKEKNIVLPTAPNPVGNYTPFARSGNLVFINQVALKDGKILYPGKIGIDITEEQAKEATRQTMLNVIAVLKNATGGDLNRVKHCVQLTGFFNTKEGYTKHADLMNPASNLTVEIFGEKGKHARGTMGSSSLPLNSPVEIQAVFEIE
ncbi:MULTISPECIES: Atu1372/SO_1960 family protein [Elizabethkingia]|uniref:NAD(P)H:quinone oxidoreductase n=1 Tax=Elizabethkingia meningoseptica TaxID=238 RepID=A0A1T3FL04_ELIME|nr:MULTISPECIES: Atu1372/SO_1960 family protein [Elizabethkingia]AQX13349.1 repressor [Elizabethkingia meningoseptica]MBG0514987.1 NAD(P)H-dependent oxidoreductase [Elizabethkingia meningoseptica]MDE5434514.1 NAD(P)H-dependent oxidoreductase [Elizabethkingia meningoseptica]MDE5481377.1 NAD(P)H-dependent oxidoreductase [Elizabethkingia meningoseptica]MDE5537101.1 NAD(P)H-dependent oxidoreductase [Elizabethkingia meningoseptica]